MRLSDEVGYRILRYLADHPEATQRDLAAALGISLGKANYCLRALISKGILKVRNFKNSNRKAAYAYYLTPRGAEAKIAVTRSFLQHKQKEYDLLRQEIERLTHEVTALGTETAKR